MNKIFFNSSLLLLARALQMIASFIVMMVLLPRYLTLVDFGRYSAIVVSVGAVMTISFFGIGKLLIRDIARNKENAADLTGMALTVRTLLLILASAVTALIMWIKGVPDIHTGMAIAFVVLFFIFDSYSLLFFNVFQAYEKMHFEPIIMFFSSLFQVLATVAIVTLDLGFCAIFVVMVITALVRFSFGLGIMLRSFIVPTFGFTKSDFWRFVRESSIVGLGVFLYLNLFRINTILLDWIHGSEETAYYQSVYNLVIQLQVIPTVLTVAMFPGLARRFTDPKALKDVLCSRMIRYFAIFGVTISWPLFCLSGEIVAILGEKYAYSAIPLRILAWTCIGLFVDMACNNILVAAGKQSLTLLTVIIAMIINLCIAYFLIPAFGSAGAAMTALATDISLLIISTGIVLWWCKGLPKLLSCFGGLAISTAAALATTLILCKELNPFLAVIVGGIVYLTIIMLTGTISIKEVKEILYTRKGPTEIKASKPSKVLLIGWDGATFDILSPLMKKGQMPNMAKLIDNGTKGRLLSTIPALTPTAWSTISTGVNPGKHGIFDALLLSRKERKLRFATAANRLSPTVWKILSEKGKKSGIFNVPLTYPADQIDGFVIPGMFTPPDVHPFIEPPELENELKSMFGPYKLECNQHRNPKKYYNNIMQMIEQREKHILYLMDDHPTEFSFFTFIASDRAQHFFWKYLDPEHPKHNSLGKYIEKVYARLDETLGKIVAKAGHETTVMMVSDHGMGTLNHAFFLNNWLMQNNYLHLKQDPEALMNTDRPSLAQKITTKILNNALPISMQKKLGIDKSAKTQSDVNLFLSQIDWSKTTAYSEGVSGSIFINEDVVPESARDQLCNEISEKLKALKGPDGKLVISEIHYRDDIYTGSAIEDAGELLIVCSRGYTLIAPNEMLYFGKDYKSGLFVTHRWSGKHEPEGIFVASGAHIQKDGECDLCSVTDISPTILHLMGEAVPEHMDGKVLTDIFEKEWVDQNPVRFESTSSAEKSDEQIELTPTQEQAVTDRLKDLGYME